MQSELLINFLTRKKAKILTGKKPKLTAGDHP